MWAVGPVENPRQFDDGNIAFELGGERFTINPTRFTFHAKHLAPLQTAIQTGANIRLGYGYGKPKSEGGFWLNVKSIQIDDGSAPPPVQQTAPVAAQPVAGIPMGPNQGQMPQAVQGIPQQAQVVATAAPTTLQGVPVTKDPKDRNIRASVALKAAINVIGPLNNLMDAHEIVDPVEALAPYADVTWQLASIFDEMLEDLAEMDHHKKTPITDDTDDDGELVDLLQRSLDATVVDE
jgi:hypothetical protein